MFECIYPHEEEAVLGDGDDDDDYDGDDDEDDDDDGVWVHLAARSRGRRCQGDQGTQQGRIMLQF